MKSVLIVDAPPMLREFLKEKLSAEQVTVETADGQRDALPKFLSMLPDLLIINIEQSVIDIIDFLEKKQSDPNGKKIPVIMSGPEIERYEASELVQYGVIKYFTRPIQFDLYFDAIGRVLHLAFAVDHTPSVLDIHLNHDIIFIEMAMGLNREKIMLLKYKLSELIEKNKLLLPKVVIMMTDLSLSYVDGLNMELLLENITADKRIIRRNIKILSLDKFVSDFIEGHQIYEGIQVVQNLSAVLNSLVEGDVNSSLEDMISDKILTASKDSDQGSIELRFNSDAHKNSDKSDALTEQVKIAVVDPELATIKQLKDTLETIGEITVFMSAKDFLAQLKPNQFNIVISEMYMPEVTGLDVLKYLIEKRIDLPVIIYSRIVQKELIMQSLKMGASSYLIKPQPSEVILQKVLEIINAKQ